MSIDPAVLTALQALRKPAVCGYLAVEWPDGTLYYSDSAYNQLPPFIGIGHVIQPQLLQNLVTDVQFELNPDLRTEQIPLTFNDLPDRDGIRPLSPKFKEFSSSIRCEIFFFYPDVDLTVSLWFGTLKAPNIFGWKQLQTVATNGFRAREFTVPSSMRPRECRRKAFGGRLPTAFAVQTNVCPYDRHLGGSVGLLNGAVPFIDCPSLTTADCTARFGHDRFWGGYNTDASATVTDGNSGYIAHSKGNGSNLKRPIRVVAGTKHLRGLQLLLWKRELNANNPDHGFVASVWEVSDGAVKNMRNFKVQEKIIEHIHISARAGERGQPAVANYNPGGFISNFSGVAHFNARYGWVNPLDISASNLTAECDVDGYREVAVFNETGAGNGLVGNYYSDVSWSSLFGTRTDHYINFPSTTAPPIEGMDPMIFSVRWTGQIQPRYSETYTFTLQHDNGAKLWVNNTVVIDQLGTLGTHTGTIALTADTLYDIRVDFFQGTAPGIHPWFCVLKWQSASQALEVVPNSRLFHAGAAGLVRQWTNDRVWWLLECYTNHRFGMGHPFSRFATDDFKRESVFNLQAVQFQHVFPDGETKTFSGRRTTFDAVLEGRAAADQIEDICRSGALAVPFQYDGKLTTISFRAFTEDELDAAPIFTDTGNTPNIVWDEGKPSITFSKIPDEILTNEVILTFEEAENFDTERPITVDDPDQKLKAGRALGEDSLQAVPKRVAAFGIRYLQEAIRLGYRLLKFGEFDSGGTHNNLTAVFYTPTEQCLGLKRYQPIQIVSQLLDGHESPEGNQFEYFRVLHLKKVGNGLIEITAQAYNQAAYEGFETVLTPNPEPPGNQTPLDPPPRGHIPPDQPIDTVNYLTTGHLEVTLF